MTHCKYCNIELATVPHKGYICRTCKNGLNRYGLNRNEQTALLESQDCKCALCEEPIQLHIGNVFEGVIDHNHDTGTVRGVLCSHCNVALGKLEGPKLEKFIKNVTKYIV